MTEHSVECLVNQTTLTKMWKYPQIDNWWTADYLHVVGPRNAYSVTQIDQITYVQQLFTYHCALLESTLFPLLATCHVQHRELFLNCWCFYHFAYPTCSPIVGISSVSNCSPTRQFQKWQLVILPRLAAHLVIFSNAFQIRPCFNRWLLFFFVFCFTLHTIDVQTNKFSV